MVSFSLLGQQFFSPWAIHSCSCSNSCALNNSFLVVLVVFRCFHIVTDFASAFISGVRQFVAAFAISLSSILGARATTSQHIVSLWAKFQVHGIAAAWIVADYVIQTRYVSTNSPWQWFNQPCIHETVSRDDLAFVVSLAVASSRQAACPVPTAGSLIDINLGKQLSDSFSRKMRDYEKLGVRHLDLRSG